MAGRKYVSYEVEPVVMASLLARFGPIRAPVQVLNGSRGAGRGVSSNHERQTRLITPDIALRPIEVPWAICTPLSPGGTAEVRGSSPRRPTRFLSP